MPTPRQILASLKQELQECRKVTSKEAAELAEFGDFEGTTAEEYDVAIAVVAQLDAYFNVKGIS